MSKKCIKCNDLCPDGISCDFCGSFMHSDCVGLSRAEVQCLRQKQRRIPFYCEDCDIVKLVKSLKDQIQRLSNEIANIKKEVSPVSSIDKTLSEDDIINEIMERQQKAVNIIVYNLPESGKETSTERANDDADKCINIIKKKTPNVTIVKCSRLGKPNKDRPRLIKLQLPSADQVLQVLKSYKVENNIYLNQDLTIKQRNYTYNNRTEFRSRKAKGENDIVLKYSNGMPKIVKKNLSQPSSQ
ncbi:hypothetical protein Zmor_003620 [Zophobas morio]|uniref:Zinc finger PHD-type domain-containing protein n=1 Tax=Zophobas morio TaxID=2755281 RepID=A0AA38M1U2_9CUCU|nr:hypothetical protein Zmor_003620 [Zophobas morio]